MIKNPREGEEFYTMLTDIEEELKHYEEHFKDKIVYCNCDDPRMSNFFHYFFYNFKKLGLKKLITTCYKDQGRALFNQNSKKEKAVCLEYEGDKIGIKDLKGDGDFRSKECIEFLKQADIVVTNPPFSLYRNYVAQLFEYGKKFVIIGPLNAVAYKEISPLIRDNKIWLGGTLDGRSIWFRVPDNYKEFHKVEDGIKYAFVKDIVWFTNLDYKIEIDS